MMTKVEFVSEQKDRKTPLRKKTEEAWRQERRRALSTIEELNEQEVSESEVENSDQKNAKNPCVVTIAMDIVEIVGISRENSLLDETGEEEQAAKVENKVNKVNKVKNKVNKVWDEWRQHFTIDQFLFSLFLGLIPTAWDVFSDLRFGADLASENQTSAAGQNLSRTRVSDNVASCSLTDKQTDRQGHWSLTTTPEPNKS